MGIKKLFSLMLCVTALSACAETQLASHVAKKGMGGQEGAYKIGNPYEVMGRTYQPKESYKHVETGRASWYGDQFNGKRTANGETFDKNALTAAHRTLQMPSVIRVTNLENGRTVILRVNDRGPFSKERVLDVSEKAAQVLGFRNQGTTDVKIEVLERESQHVAELAKRGVDTTGIEVAMNKGTWRATGPREPITQLALNDAGSNTAPQAVHGNVAMADPAPLRPLTHTDPSANPAARPHQSPQALNSNLHLTAASSHNTLRPSDIRPSLGGNIYVQAGAFNDRANAQRLADHLGHYGEAHVQPANVNGRTLYRVRIGPVADRTHAGSITQRLGDSGTHATIVVID